MGEDKAFFNTKQIYGTSIDIVDDVGVLGRKYSRKVRFSVTVSARDNEDYAEIYRLLNLTESGGPIAAPVPLSYILKIKDSLLIGTGWNGGMLEWAAKGIIKLKDIKRVVSIFDYLEISRIDKKELIDNSEFALYSPKEVERNNKLIEKWGKRYHKPVVTVKDAMRYDVIFTKKIYLDMDGVLADFDGGVSKLCGIEPVDQTKKTEADDDRMWDKVRQIEHFYDKLEPMPGAIELYKYLSERFGDKVEILSGIPKPRRGIANAAEDKTSWAHRLLSEDLKVNIVYREEKIKYCTGRDCILIDDYQKNIDEWNAAGGTGILFESTERTKDIFDKVVIG